MDEANSKQPELSEVELAIAAIEEDRRQNFEKARLKEELRLKLYLATQDVADQLMFPENENSEHEDYEN